MACAGARATSGICPAWAMIRRTALRLSLSPREIPRIAMPSWWSRNTALRLSAVIIELLEGFGEGRQPAQQAGAQQMGLGVAGAPGEPLILAFGNDVQSSLLRLLPIGQQQP